MDDPMMETIRRTFYDVMEKQVFMFSEPAERGGFSADETPFLLGWMNFHGASAGNLLIAVPEGMAREIGANFLGMEADDPFVEETYQDSLKEILNVTCGHMLTALKGETPVFDLSIPNVTPMTSAELSELADDPSCLAFDVDGYPVLLRMDFDPVSDPRAKRKS
jgi:CheY-specific phosphatase CheX